MGKERKPMPGLRQRGKVWWIDKKINGQRIQESTGTTDLDEAERYLIYKLEQLRQAKVYGVRQKRTFAEAAAKYIKEKKKRSIGDDIGHLDTLMPYIGEVPIDSIHEGTPQLKLYIEERQNGKFAEKVAKGQIEMSRCKEKVTNQTINAALKVVIQILNLAAGLWRDENNNPWLMAVPIIPLLDEQEEKRKAIPLSWAEQDKLFAELSPDLKLMALFAVNTGCRNDEICDLLWEWEIPIPSLNTSVFVIPANKHKNRRERLVILNDIAKGIIEEVRGQHPTYVFTHLYPNGERKKYYDMNATSWRKGRERAGLPHVRVHDLKHTFGARLEEAGVSPMRKKQLLGHRAKKDITDHYSFAGIRKLIASANKVCKRRDDISVAGFLKQLNANAKNGSGNLIPFTGKQVKANLPEASTLVHSKAF